MTAELSSVAGRSDGRLRIAEVPVGTQVAVRARPAPVSVAGIVLPATPNTAVRTGTVRALWLGPDEWLLLDPAGRGLEDRVRAALAAGQPGSAGAAFDATAVVDVSAARVLLEIAGPAARGVLAHGCAIDLDPSRFGPGTCVQTRLALADVILLAVRPDGPGDDPVFHVLVRPSFREYLLTWLLDAATEVLRPRARQVPAGRPSRAGVPG